jgi:hypothetical protein
MSFSANYKDLKDSLRTGVSSGLCVGGCRCVGLREREREYGTIDIVRPSIAWFVTCCRATTPTYTQLPVESPGIAGTTDSLPTFSILTNPPKTSHFFILIMFDDVQYLQGVNCVGNFIRFASLRKILLYSLPVDDGNEN